MVQVLFLFNSREYKIYTKFRKAKTKTPLGEEIDFNLTNLMIREIKTYYITIKMRAAS